MDCYSKLTWAILVPKTTGSHETVLVFENWITLYNIPNTVITENGLQIVSKLFAALGASIEAKLNTTTEYHLQANGQQQRFNRTLVARLRHYSGKHQTDWDNYVQLLNYG